MRNYCLAGLILLSLIFHTACGRLDAVETSHRSGWSPDNLSQSATTMVIAEVIEVQPLPDDLPFREGVHFRRRGLARDSQIGLTFSVLVPKTVHYLGRANVVMDDEFEAGDVWYLKLREIPDDPSWPQIGNIDGKPWIFLLAAAAPGTEGSE